MGLPRVDPVDVVLKTPEPEKGRDRVRKPGERERGPARHAAGGQSGRDGNARLRAPLGPQPDEDASPPAAEPVGAEAQSDPEPVIADSPHHPAYGPAADLRDDEPERHNIDYRA